MSRRKNPPRLYAVCTDNKGYEASLEVAKLYQIVPDADAEADGMLRVIDNSGEDYLFEETRFYRVELPLALVRELYAR